MYLKLGKGASCFYDITSKLNLRGQGEAVEYNGNNTKRITLGLKGGAIVEIQEAEYLTMKAAWDELHPANAEGQELKAKAKGGKAKGGKEKEKDPKADQRAELMKKSETELVEYYKENFDVDEEDEDAFLKLKTMKAKVDFLLED